MENLDMSRGKGRAASGFRSKVHSHAESLSLESLDMKSWAANICTCPNLVAKVWAYVAKVWTHTFATHV